MPESDSPNGVYKIGTEKVLNGPWIPFYRELDNRSYHLLYRDFVSLGNPQAIEVKGIRGGNVRIRRAESAT